MITIKPISKDNRAETIHLLKNSWKTSIIVNKGKTHDLELLNGYIAEVNNEIKGIVTYCLEQDECEIVSLDSFEKNQGIGSALINQIINIAQEKNLNKVWLVSTNDNINAFCFYQKMGFNINAFHKNSISEARKIKPEIPLYGYEDIPIMHELEFEILIK